jgi:quercetin dioxygenase-like cupin family protein
MRSTVGHFLGDLFEHLQSNDFFEEGTTLNAESPADVRRRAGVLSSTKFADWSDDVKRDFSTNSQNSRIGSKLLSTNERVRVWSINLEPGERLGAHRHALSYFWVALTSGCSRQHFEDGSTRIVTYVAGDTCHFDFDAAEYLLHDLENVGDGVLSFVTVEFLARDKSSHESNLTIMNGDSE